MVAIHAGRPPRRNAIPARSFDVVILGGGNAGMGVTVATREAGLTVAMIEPDLLGGTVPTAAA
jgi:pyruvate/2-oxoglutarate dehydrogenase complex dihydrolipoamide dehydrogenase (E3) component